MTCQDTRSLHPTNGHFHAVSAWRRLWLRRVCPSVLLLLLAVNVGAQSERDLSLPVIDLLQYQRAKAKRKEPPVPFRKYGMKRIRAAKVLSDDDSRRIWGYQVGANTEYDKEKQPLYRLFRRNTTVSMAVIDRPSEEDGSCLLVFWNKKYYRRYASELQRMGFTLRNSSRQTNILEFRKEGVSVGVDVTIWPDIYLLEVVTLPPSS